MIRTYNRTKIKNKIFLRHCKCKQLGPPKGVVIWEKSPTEEARVEYKENTSGNLKYAIEM